MVVLSFKKYISTNDNNLHCVQKVILLINFLQQQFNVLAGSYGARLMQFIYSYAI